METETNKDNKYLVPLAIIIAGLMIAGAIYMGGSEKASLTNNGSATIEVEPVDNEDHLRGDRNAPIVVIEYSDLECPFCKVFHNTMKEVLNTYPGQVAWVYRHFPIPQLHQKAIQEAIATECAADQGGDTAFWSYIDKVFEMTNSNDSLDLTVLPQIAGDIGLDVAAFNTCITSGKFDDMIQEQMEEAVKAGARGTPYSVIVTKDGEEVVINGAEPFASIKQKIDTLLQ